LLVGFAIGTPFILGPYHLSLVPATLSFALLPMAFAAAEQYRRERTPRNLSVLTVLGSGLSTSTRSPQFT
jgi:hypothetical protein